MIEGVPGVIAEENWEQLLTVRERTDGTDGARFKLRAYRQLQECSPSR